MDLAEDGVGLTLVVVIGPGDLLRPGATGESELKTEEGAAGSAGPGTARPLAFAGIDVVAHGCRETDLQGRGIFNRKASARAAENFRAFGKKGDSPLVRGAGAWRVRRSRSSAATASVRK